MSIQQLATFEIAGDEYGIDIHCINGIVRANKYAIRKIPNSAGHVQGVINLRGKVVSVFNLRKKFQVGDRPITDEDKIIIVTINGGEAGFLVDDVTDIFKINDGDIELPPAGLQGRNAQYLTGISKVEEKLILVLDLAKILNERELELAIKAE